MSKKKIDPQDAFMGIDYGSVRTGTAIGKNNLVMPLQTYKNLSDGNLVHEITKIAVENKIAGFVLGLPLEADGKETKQSLIVRKFGKLLKTITRKPVFMQNEFNSSGKSLEEAINLEASLSKRTHNDSLSAAFILKEFYNEHSIKP